MANYESIYGASSLTGGADASLDSIDGTDLQEGDLCVVITSTYTYTYELDATSGAAESSPDVISPDDNAGTKRWILREFYVGNIDHGNLDGLTDDDHVAYHTDARGDARYYTETELDAGQLDDRYYTETELDAGQLDDRYYTETEIDATFTTVSGDILTYVSANYIDTTEMTTISGDIIDQIPTDYYTQAQVDGKWATWSGTIDHDTITNNHNLTTDIDHNQLTNYAVGQHRVINDAGTESTELWSASQIESRIVTATGTLTTAHSELTELDYASAGHTGFQASGDYVTDTEMTTISGDLVTGYTTADTTLSGILHAEIVASSGTTDHSVLENLDYASSGHTGFQASGDYVTTAVLTTASGDIVDQIPTDYYTTGEVDAISGSLSAEIDADIVAHSASGDHDGRYYTKSEIGATTSGYTAGADLIGVPILGSATYDKLGDVVNLINSTGRVSGGTISDAGGETINVTAGAGFIKAEDNDTAELLSFDWATSNGIAVPSGVNYVGVIYNAGSPEVDIRQTDNYDLDTEFALGKVVNEEGTLHILNSPWWVSDGITNILERFKAAGHLVRDGHIGGLILSVLGTRNIAVTAGTLWSLLNEFPITAIDTSVSGTVETYWVNSSGEWTDADISQYPITQWNDTTLDALQNMNNNYYANWWVYVEADDDEVSLIYPQAQYVNSASAEAETPPTDIPTHISENGILIGRILFKKGTDAPVEVQTVWDTTFTASQAADHGNLAGLIDDDHTQYLNTTRGDARYYTETEIDNTLNDYVLADGTRNITGPFRFEDAVIVDGDFTVSGTTFHTAVEEVLINDNLLIINYGETASGVSAGWAGIEVDRGLADTYRFVFHEADGFFEIGISGSEQAVATREDSPIDTAFGYWNASEYRFDTSADYTTSTIVTESELTTVSGDIVAQFPTDFYTQAEVTTISGDIVAQIPSDYITDAEMTTISGDIITQMGTVKEGTTAIDNAASSVDVVFPSAFDDATYVLNYNLKNITDATPAQYGTIISATTSGGFTVTLSSPTDSANYYIEWRATDQGYAGVEYGVTLAALTTILEDYYTETELDAGQLDNRYYTETEVDTISGAINSDKMSDLVDDTTPQLGGDLDTNGSDILFGSDTISGTGTIVTGDHGTATLPQTVNVVYGTGDPPTASDTTEGTIFIKYTA